MAASLQDRLKDARAALLKIQSEMKVYTQTLTAGLLNDITRLRKREAWLSATPDEEQAKKEAYVQYITDKLASWIDDPVYHAMWVAEESATRNVVRLEQAIEIEARFG